MSEQNENISRRDQILQALVHMLETNPGARITTASLASHQAPSNSSRQATLSLHTPATPLQAFCL